MVNESLEVYESAMSFAESLANSKEEESQNREIKLEISETFMCLGGIKEEPSETKNNEDDITDIYETTSTKDIKEEDKIEIDGPAVFLENNKYEPRDDQSSCQDGLIYTSSHSYCKKCKRYYEGFCSGCSKLCYILHNISKMNNENLRNTVPKGILEVRDTASGVGVFALKSIPEGIIFGPSDDLLAVLTTNGMLWKIKHRQLISTENKNWMQCVNCAQSTLYQNLEIFQYKNCLYFRSIREINVGEELLLYYFNISNGVEETYYYPRVQKELKKVYACTFCCLGFKLKAYLKEHKTHCPHSQKTVIAVEIIQCSSCNIFLEREEYLQHHMIYCSERSRRKYASVDPIQSTPMTHKELYQDFSNQKDINSDVGHKIYNSIKCTVATNCTSERQFKCDECEYQTNRNASLKLHQLTHSGLTSDLNYSCDKCDFQSNNKNNLKKHLLTHGDSTSDKEYKCDKCKFQTHYKTCIKSHQLTHAHPLAEKKYRCDKCKFQTQYKRSIEGHQLKHAHRLSESKYKCSKCEFQTDHKNSIKVHQRTHTIPLDKTKYKCGKCEFYAHRKSTIERHLLLTHAYSLSERKYQCDKCDYQTDTKNCLTLHQFKHAFPRSTEKFKCGNCEFQTNDTHIIKRHLLTHANTFAEKKLQM